MKFQEELWYVNPHGKTSSIETFNAVNCPLLWYDKVNKIESPIEACGGIIDFDNSICAAAKTIHVTALEKQGERSQDQEVAEESAAVLL